MLTQHEIALVQAHVLVVLRLVLSGYDITRMPVVR